MTILETTFNTRDLGGIKQKKVRQQFLIEYIEVIMDQNL